MFEKVFRLFSFLKAKGLENAGARQAFLKYDLQLRIRRLKVGSVMILILEPLGYNLDHTLYPIQAVFFLKLRFLCAFLAGICLILAYFPWVKHYEKPLGLLLPLLPNFFTSWMIYATQGSVSPYYAGITQVLMAVALVMPWSAWETALVSLISMFFYFEACYGNGPLDHTGIFYNNMSFLINTEIIIVIGSYLTYNWRVRQFALSYELDQSRRLLEETNRKLVELDKMKTSFFANINHELRTPLTLLISPLESLQAEKSHLFDAETREVLKTMESNAMRLLKLINDLLDLVKLESGVGEIRKEPMKVEEFIKGLALSVQGVARDKRVHLSSSIDEGLGSVLADRDKLEKIVLNLVFNSVKFTPAGGKVELLAREEGNFLVLQVKDTGMGISEQNLLHIFDRFWQADASSQRKYQGTGIGLSLVKELTEAQGGTVTAESQLGKGTIMTVKIPLEKTQEISSPKTMTTQEEFSKVESESDEWLTKLYRRAELFPAMTPVGATLKRDKYGKSQKPRVLVADDEPDMLRFLKTQLGKHYEILEAVDGNQAVEKARQFLPDLVLLDMMMPEKDGIQVCQEMKNLTSTQSIPVILLTARADDKTKMSALNAGASDFLTKPFSTTELHVRVKNLVESHQFQMDLGRQKSALESTLEQLKETEGQLVQNEKMASLGRLSAGIIHEINNPLNYAHSALHVLKMKKDRLPPEDREKYSEVVGDIEEGIGRVQRIVSDLRTFTHPKFGGAVDLIELEETVSTALRFLSHELKDKIKVDLKIPKDQQVLADRNKLVHVFVNLLQNAVDALNEKKFMGEEPSLEIQSREKDGKVLVSVRDNGAGIAPENLDKIFDPFFTTKDVGQGMGLGLSLCYKILEDQGGRITAKSEQGKFTEFDLEIPAKK
jgi:signal transduction histidine kinase